MRKTSEQVVQEIREKVRDWERALKPDVPRYYQYKWYIDVLLTVAMLPVAFPLVFVFGFLTWATSRGPIFHTQVRCSQGGKPFNMYKIRSMVADAESESGAVWAQKNDPRVTWIGNLIRKLHVDELPQIWNIWRGEMTLVGPRPERPEFVEPFLEARDKIFHPEFEKRLIADNVAAKMENIITQEMRDQEVDQAVSKKLREGKENEIREIEIKKILYEYAPDYVIGYEHRLAVLPGLAGYAQINLPPDIDMRSVRKKLILDLEYIRRAAPWFDIRILLGTVFKCFRITRFASLRRIQDLPLRLCGVYCDPSNAASASIVGIGDFDVTTLGGGQMPESPVS